MSDANNEAQQEDTESHHVEAITKVAIWKQTLYVFAKDSSSDRKGSRMRMSDQMSLTCSSNQVHNSADRLGSFAVDVACPTRAQGMRYLPFNSAPSGDVPAHNCVNAPYGTGYRTTRTMKYSIREKWRHRSVLRFPGLRDVDTMPWSPYRRANSFDIRTFPSLLWVYNV